MSEWKKNDSIIAGGEFLIAESLYFSEFTKQII